jgi:type IV fimbrial biogenesis protein FimT
MTSKSRKTMRYSRAFTLIELMVTLAILAILLGIAAPSFREAIQNSRTQTITNSLVSALQFARSEAIKRGTGVDICRQNTDGTACEDNTTWQSGWLVKLNGAGGEVLRVWDATINNDSVTGPAETLTYRSDGMLTKAPDDDFVVAFTSCTGKPMYTITLTATGRASSAKGTCP